MIKNLKKNYFLLIVTFLIIYFFFNLLDGERGLISYFEKKEIYMKFKTDQKDLSDKIVILEQKNSFLEHIQAAQETKLPLIVHTRSAEIDTLNILKNAKKEKDFKILIHCFTGSKKFAFNLIDLGAFISASGVVTFKNSRELAETFKEIPESKILVETDSPYLAPVPLRGKSNEPGNITHTVEFLSKLKNISFDALANKTTENFFSLFGKLD